ncbi:hypothetical protein ACFX15_024571 [Malus domestica]
MDCCHPKLLFDGEEQNGQGIMAKSSPLDVIKCLKSNHLPLCLSRCITVSSGNKGEQSPAGRASIHDT